MKLATEPVRYQVRVALVCLAPTPPVAAVRRRAAIRTDIRPPPPGTCAQTVTVDRSTDDADTTRRHRHRDRTSATSHGDTDYNNLAAEAIAVTVTDNDSPCSASVNPDRHR